MAGAVCQNDDCQATTEEIPAWPWSRCGHCGCGMFAVGCMSFPQWCSMFWSLVLGVLALGLGYVIESGRVESVGIFLIGYWFISRLIHGMIRSAEIELNIQEAARVSSQQKFDSDMLAGTIDDEAKARKLLKDEYDRVRGLDWKVQRNVWMGKLSFHFTLFLILLVGLSWGPGQIIPWTASDVHDAITQEAKNNDLVNTATSQTKNDWDEKKIIFLQNKLVRERYVTVADFKKLLGNDLFDFDTVVSVVNTTPVYGDELVKKISSALMAQLSVKNSEAKKLASAKAKKDALDRDKSKFQQMRKFHWLVMLSLVFMYSLFLILLGVTGLGTFAMQMAYTLGDEGHDQFKLAVEKAMVRKGLKNPNPAPPNTGQPAASSDENGGSIWSTIVGSVIAEVFVHLIGKFNKGI